METTTSLLKKTLLVFVFLLILLGRSFASDGIQTTFTVSGNNITVKMKSDITVGGTFTQFISDFRYLASDNPTFTVTSSVYSPVLVAANIPDPNDPLYRLQRFSFSGGTTTPSLAIGTEYPVFTFMVSGGVGVGTIGLSMDDPTYTSNPDYTFNTGSFADFSDPFYGSLTNSDFTVSGAVSASGNDETWWWRTASVDLGKTWLVTAATTDWQTGSNWSDGLVPTATESVTILNGLNNPVAGAGSVCKDMQVVAGAAVHVAETGTLTVDGNFSVADDFPTGYLALVVESSAAGTGSFIVEGTVPSDKVLVERYFAGTDWTNNDDGWHLLSSPISNGLINVPSGFRTNDAAPNRYDFYSWAEPTQLWMNIKDPANSGIFTTFSVGKGYIASYETADTKQFEGTLNNSNVNLSLTNNGGGAVGSTGYNLLGNPFSSAITWNTAGWNLSNVGANATQVWSNMDKDYVTIGDGAIIPATNGFMVYAGDGGGTLTIPLAARTHSATPFYKSSEPQIKLVAHDPEGASMKSSMIRVNPEATAGFDLAYDAYMLSGYAPVFYSVADNSAFTINTIAAANNGLVVPFGFVKNGSTNFTIELAENIDGTLLVLRDKKTNTMVNMSQGSSYAFTSAEGDDANRFELLFGTQVGIEETGALAAANVYNVNGHMVVSNVKGDTQMNIFNVQGQLLKNFEFNSNGNQEISVNLPTGIYMVRLINGGAMKTMKVFVN